MATKKTISNPLKTFNDNQAMAYKKAGGAMSAYKKSLKKAQYGRGVYEGPINEKDVKKLDKWYPSTAPVAVPNAPKEADLIRGLNPFVNGQMVSDQEREFMERQKSENKLRRGYKTGGATKDKKWIQKAVNPKHKGYCTPMSKPTCTPKRKALARTFKAMAKKR